MRADLSIYGNSGQLIRKVSLESKSEQVFLDGKGRRCGSSIQPGEYSYRININFRMVKRGYLILRN